MQSYLICSFFALAIIEIRLRENISNKFNKILEVVNASRF